jgi:hypothetical protein
MKPRLKVSFSGGRTSGFMAYQIKKHWSDVFDVVFIFANTGFEHPDTLRFANDVDTLLGLNLVWVEAVVHHGDRVASTHKVVDYKTASRQAEPFYQVASKYGLPNRTFRLCNREMKLNPMRSYIEDELGWGKDYDTAIGIRADEKRRVSKNMDIQRILYPLIDTWPSTKQDILDFWEEYACDLKIPEHLGNCLTCFQKSDAKLNQVYREFPNAFQVFADFEKLYGGVGPNVEPGPRKIFRMKRDTPTLIKTFKLADADSSKLFDTAESGGCSESCEPYDFE